MVDIQLSYHAGMVMQRRRITLEDVALTLQLGEHTEGRAKYTGEAYLELDEISVSTVFDLVRCPRNSLMNRHCEEAVADVAIWWRGADPLQIRHGPEKENQMKVTYDRDADVLAILLADEEVEATRSLAPGVEADYDSRGRILAIEFLNASREYDLDGVEMQSPDPWYSLAAAGSIFGLSPTTLRHQIERGVLHGVKAGRNWLVHRDDLDEYMKRRSRKAKHMAAV